MNLQKRGKRQRSGILSKRGPGTSKSYNQVRMHSSINPKIDKTVKREAKRIEKPDGAKVWKFRGVEYTNIRAANFAYMQGRR